MVKGSALYIVAQRQDWCNSNDLEVVLFPLKVKEHQNQSPLPGQAVSRVMPEVSLRVIIFYWETTGGSLIHNGVDRMMDP